MVVVSDTTAVTTLLKCGEEQLLQELFGSIHVPQGVLNELSAFHSSLPGFLILHPSPESEIPFSGEERLGRGEVEAIKLALQIQSDLLLMDERKGRLLAVALGIQCAGLPSIIVGAKARKLIPSAGALLQKLESTGGALSIGAGQSRGVEVGKGDPSRSVVRGGLIC